MNNWVSVYNMYQTESVIIRQHAVCVLSQAKGKKRIKFCKKTCLNGSEEKKEKRPGQNETLHVTALFKRHRH